MGDPASRGRLRTPPSQGACRSAQDNKGTVLAESHKDKKAMENHKYREEVVQANMEDFGFKIRHSDTLKKDFIYVVKKYKINDQKLYIRLSKELEEVNEQIISLGIKVVIVLIIFLATLFFITYKISIQVQLETKKILNFLLDLTKKRKKHAKSVVPHMLGDNVDFIIA